MAKPGRARDAGREFGFEARCIWCGPVTVDHDSLHVFVSPRGTGLFEFLCPGCDRDNFRSLSISDLEALALAGVRPVGGRAPFELLEERSGPPIGWDDLIDFHQALTQAENGSQVTWFDGRPGPRALERDAA
ncbi:MAG TPA: hypothetical protein VEQ37_06770 [Actinomycetota bacterium]|nr:hypothetical protein [Actinomycetota bacterium]